MVRPGVGDIDLTCGGHPAIASQQAPAAGLSLSPELAGGSSLGKRYIDEASDVELLVTKAGQGTLAAGEKPLTLKEAKPLPASD